MFIKNLNADKPPTCTACRKVIAYREKYFTLPSSFQRYCLQCAPKEIQRIIDALNRDLATLRNQ
ncbi:MAG: hypothetical protein V3T40_00625 [Nitrososphaerales archaeon]